MKATNSGYLNSQNSGAFPSPEMPCHEAMSLGIGEGWTSERVPSSRHGSRRYINITALMPFSSGRALPSKWDDAERWISSPVLGNGNSRIPLVRSQRPAKSKSGPVVHSGLAFVASNSPILPAVDDASVRNSVTVDSPGNGGGRKSCHGKSELDLALAREWLEMIRKPPTPISQGDKFDNTEDAHTQRENGGNSVRDAATQMLSEVRAHSSPTRRSSMSSLSYQHEIKEVQVDKQATATQSSDNCPDQMSLQSEEAKINAWESLQKAKAEAAIRELEMKLEKKRTSSIDKIMKKLRRAQLKAEKKRSLLSEGCSNGFSRSSSKMALLQKYLDEFNKKLKQMLG